MNVKGVSAEREKRMLRGLYERLHAACPSRERELNSASQGEYASSQEGSPTLRDAFTLGVSFLVAPYALATAARWACEKHGLEALIGTLMLGVGMFGAFSMTPEFHDVMDLAVKTNAFSFGYELGRGLHAVWAYYRRGVKV